MKFSQLLRHEGLKKYGFNTSWLLLERGFRIILAVIANGLVARYLGPEQFGVLAYASSLLTLFLSLATLGVDEPVIRDLLNPSLKPENVLGSCFFMRLVGAAISCALIWGWLFLFDHDEYSKNVTGIIIVSLFFQAFGVIDLFFQSKVSSKSVVIPNLIQQWSSLGLKIFLIVSHASLFWFAVAYVWDAAILAIGLAVVYKLYGHRITQWRFDPAFSKKLIADFWPLALAGIVTSIYVRIDQMMIKELLDLESVGKYAPVINLTEVWYMVPMLLCQSVFPAIVRAKNTDSKIYYERLQMLMDVLAGVSVFLCVVIFIFAEMLVQLIYGDQYLAAVGALRINIWGIVFVFVGSVTSRWFILENFASKNLVRILMGIGVKMTLNFLLIPRLGINGAALATLSAHFFASFLFDLLDKDCRVMFKMKLKSLALYRLVGHLRGAF